MAMSFGKHTGEAVVVGKDEPELLVTDENTLYIKGALASKPSLKGLFAGRCSSWWPMAWPATSTRRNWHATMSSWRWLMPLVRTWEERIRQFARPFDAEALSTC